MDGISPMGTSFAVDRIAERGSWTALFDAVRALNPALAPDAFDAAWQRLFADLALSGGRLERFLVLDEARLGALGTDGSVGRHWTTDGSELYVDALHVPDEADDSWNTYLVTGRVACPDMIDWVQTLRMRIDLPWENEVILRDEAEVTVLAVNRYDETFARRAERVRRDLDGSALRALRADPGPAFR